MKVSTLLQSVHIVVLNSHLFCLLLKVQYGHVLLQLQIKAADKNKIKRLRDLQNSSKTFESYHSLSYHISLNQLSLLGLVIKKYQG